MRDSRNCLIVVSNRSDVLAKELGQKAFSGCPFESKIVIVPSLAQKNKLLFSLADERGGGVCAGLQFYTVEQFLSFQLQRRGEGKRLLSALELALLVEGVLSKALGAPGRGGVFEPVERYLFSEPKKSQGRLAGLAWEVGALFKQYGTYGRGFLEGWLAKPGWLQGVWKEVYSGDRTYPVEVCESLSSGGTQVHLFGFTALPELYRDYFVGWGACFYLLSPSPLFLGDVLSDREGLYAHKAGEEEGVALAEREEFLELVQETNRFVANFGKERKGLLSLLEREDVEVVERYVEVEAKTVLEGFREAIFYLRRGSEGLVADGSLEVHAALTKRQEVELVREALVRRYLEGCPLREMVVYCPNLPAYAPYVEAVFGVGRVPVPFTLYQVPRALERGLEKGALQLLALKGGRFAREEVLALFECAPFVRGVRMDKEEAALFCSWIRKVNVLWGFSGEHRGRVLDVQGEGVEVGTWEWGFERLLWGLATEEEGEVAPLGLVGTTETAVLGKGVVAVRKMKELLEAPAEQTLREWVVWLRALMESFFDEVPFLVEFDRLVECLGVVAEELFSFASVLKGAGHLLGGASAGFSGNREEVAFYPLAEGNVVEAKIIFVMGMEEGAFPRRVRGAPLMDREFAKAAKAPLPIDVDRNLFFELVMQAQEGLVMSYRKLAEDDGKHVAPSLFIEELLGQVGVEVQEGDHVGFRKRMEREGVCVVEEVVEVAKAEVVSLQDLLRCARNPVQLFLNRSLGIYYEWAEGNQEEFILSPLTRHRLMQEGLEASVERVIGSARKRGEMPLWQFGEVARQRVAADMQDAQEFWEEWGLNGETVYEIELNEHVGQVRVLEGSRVIMPAVRVKDSSGKERRIVGRLSQVTSQGLLVSGKSSVDEIVKVWPAYLVYLLLPWERLEKRTLLFLKDGKEKHLEVAHPDKALGLYLDYYQESLERLNLSLPRFADALLNGDEEEFEKKWESLQVELQRTRGDPYLQWLMQRPVNVKRFYIHREKRIKEVFSGLV